jgi:hypothetical protein
MVFKNILEFLPIDSMDSVLTKISKLGLNGDNLIFDI